MVDDPDDRQEAPLGRPPRLLVGEPAGRRDDLFALAVQEAEEKLAFVGRGRGRRWRIELHVGMLAHVGRTGGARDL